MFITLQYSVVKPEHDAAGFACFLVVHQVLINAFVRAKPIVIGGFPCCEKPSLCFVKAVSDFLGGKPTGMMAVGYPKSRNVTCQQLTMELLQFCTFADLTLRFLESTKVKGWGLDGIGGEVIG